jgi:ATP synthase protein I
MSQNNDQKGGLMSQNRHPLKGYVLMSAIVSQLVGSILAGVFLGRWIDGYTGTEPLFLIIGLLLGLSTGIYTMMHLIRQFYSGEQ